MSNSDKENVSTSLVGDKNKVKQDSFIVGFLAGAAGSGLSETITLPLDTAKVRMMLYGMSGPYA